MLLIPEIQTIVLLVPRCASGALKRAVKATYPQAVQLYRHMEADGVPAGYDRWPKIGLVRHPTERLWSLFKFLQTFGDGKVYDPVTGAWPPSYIARQRATVEGRSFSEWILANQEVFTHPYFEASGFRPAFTVRHPLPETRKSQFLTLRPDLGTDVYPFGDLWRLAERLGLELPRINQTPPISPPLLTNEAKAHMLNHFAWDFEAIKRGRD